MMVYVSYLQFIFLDSGITNVRYGSEIFGERQTEINATLWEATRGTLIYSKYISK